MCDVVIYEDGDEDQPKRLRSVALYLSGDGYTRIRSYYTGEDWVLPRDHVLAIADEFRGFVGPGHGDDIPGPADDLRRRPR